jgi:hypothetical protein
MTRFRANEPQVIHQTVDDETVIVDLGSGSYFSLRGSAQAIWGALDRGLDTAGIAHELAGRYDADGTDLVELVEGFVARLADDGLIVPFDGAPPGSDAGLAPEGQAVDQEGHDRPRFEPPTIERFDDLQDLILLDPVHEVSEEEGWPHARPTDQG